MVDNPPPGESGITNEMREAWRNYKESKEPGIIPWNDFVAEVGGIQKANEIKAQLSRPQQNLSAASSFQKDTDEAGADEYSESSWDDLEFDFETVSENSTPPILGLATVVVVGAILYLEASFTTLGILLISASLGFHLVALFWLEVLNMPYFGTRSEMTWMWPAWAMMLGLSIVASVVIVATAFTPTTETHDFAMIFEEGHGPTPYLDLCLFLQIALNFIFILSMQDQTPQNSVLRSPWTIASTGSLLLLILVLSSPEHQWIDEMILMVLGATIIGGTAWIYGRSETEGIWDFLFYLAIPILLSYAILDYAELPLVDSNIRNFNTMFPFILGPFILGVLCYALPLSVNDMSEEGSSDTSGLNLRSIVILGFLFVDIVALSLQTENIAIPLIPLIFSLTIFDREHSRKLGGERFRVHRILPREPSRKKKHKKVKMKFSILGATGTGKTSFTAALWTLLTTRENRDIWWSESVDSGGVHRALLEEEEFLEALAERGRKISVNQMIEYRIAATTCSKWIDQRKLPRPGPEEAFPFQAEAFGKSQSGLDKLKFGLINPDVEKRSLPQPTTEAGKVEMTISFHGEIEVVSPSFLFNRKLGKSRKGQATEIELKIVTWDIKGESFSAAVEFSRELANRRQIRKSQMTSSKITKENLKLMRFPLADPGAVTKAKELFLESSHTVLVVDLNDLLDDDKKDVEKYIRLMHRLNRDNFCDLDSLTILLNKADDLIDSTSEGMSLRGWDEMNDGSKAKELLNRATNFALDELMGEIPVDVEFVCAFGGLVPVKNERGENKKDEHDNELMRSAYPMIPVNVLEPIIEVILTSRLHSEEI